MGFLSRLNPFRKDKTTEEKLEELQKEIRYYDELRVSNLESEKRIISLLLLYSVVFYILLAVAAFLYFTPTSSWIRMFMYVLSLLVFPVLIYLTKLSLHKIFVWRVRSKETKLKALNTEKRKQLELVRETVPYAKAKEILDKFDPLHFHRGDFQHPVAKPAPSPLTPRSDTSQDREPGPAPRIPVQRMPPGPQPAPRLPHGNPPPPPPPGFIAGNGTGFPSRNFPALSRPLPNSQRSALDKFVDYLVGDGPEHRYALICRRCAGHNGMAMKEEFEYLAFRCCYCGFMHPARKTRPQPPRLAEFSDDGGTEKAAGTEDDSESRASDSAPGDGGHHERKAAVEVVSTSEEPTVKMEPSVVDDGDNSPHNNDAQSVQVRQRITEQEKGNE